MLTRCNIHDQENTRTPSIIFEHSRMAGFRPNFKIFILLRRCGSISYIFGPILWNFYSRVNFLTFLDPLSDIFVRGKISSLFQKCSGIFTRGHFQNDEMRFSRSMSKWVKWTICVPCNKCNRVHLVHLECESGLIARSIARKKWPLRWLIKFSVLNPNDP